MQCNLDHIDTGYASTSQGSAMQQTKVMGIAWPYLSRQGGNRVGVNRFSLFIGPVAAVPQVIGSFFMDDDTSWPLASAASGVKENEASASDNTLKSLPCCSILVPPIY